MALHLSRQQTNIVLQLHRPFNTKNHPRMQLPPLATAQVAQVPQVAVAAEVTCWFKSFANMLQPKCQAIYAKVYYSFLGIPCQEGILAMQQAA